MENESNKKVIAQKILKTVIIIVSTLLVLILIQLISRISILMDMANKTKLLDDINNYYATMSSINGSTSFVLTSYCNDDSLLSNFKQFNDSNNSISELLMYKNTPENEAIVLSSHNFQKSQAQIFDLKTEQPSCFIVGLSNRRINFEFNSISDLISTLKDIKSITSVYCNNKNCCSFQMHDGSQIWIDKETALPVKEVLFDEMTYYTYSLNSVTDENVKRPNLTGYEIKQN